MNYASIRFDEIFFASHLPGDRFMTSTDTWMKDLELSFLSSGSRLYKTIVRITHIVSGLFLICCFPILIIVKTFSAHKQMQNFLPIWKKLALAINHPFDNNIENLSWRQKVKFSFGFYPWFIAHSDALSHIENPMIKQIYINIRNSLIKNNCLKKLNLSNKGLTRVPDIVAQLTNLKELDLGDNHLTTLPDNISQLTNLQSLYIRGNRLTVLPESISQLSNLRHLNLCDNRIATLPNSLLQLPFECLIFLFGNRLSAETVQAFQTELERVREVTNSRLGPQIRYSIHDHNPQSASISLETAVQFWLSEYQKACPNLSINQQISHYDALLAHVNKDRLHQFLDRLKCIADFKNGGAAKKQVIYQTGQMLETAVADASYREVLFLGLEEALATCGDRVNMYFNILEINWRLSKSKDVSDEALVELLVGVTRNDMLQNIVEKRVKQLGKGDAIEVHLYYQVELKDQLKLPFSMKNMLYKKVGEIPEKILNEDRNTVLKATTAPKDVADILCTYKQWVERITAKNQVHFEELSDAFQVKFEDLSKKPINKAYYDANEALQAKYKQQTDALVKELTLEYLHANPRQRELIAKR